MLASARETIAATAERTPWTPTRRPPPSGVIHKTTTAPPPERAPTPAPAVTKAWLSDMLVEIIGGVIETERSASGLRAAESERRIEALERRVEALTGERRVEPPALRVVGE